MDRVVAGTVIRAGACGEDDITSANLSEMADTIEARPLSEADRRELVLMLRWLAQLVNKIEQADRSPCTD
jgi:hypothetical protein